MSSSDGAFDKGRVAPILPPYTPDHDSGAQRRLKRIVVAAVLAFCLFYGMAFSLLGAFLPLAFAVPLVILMLFAIWALPDSRRAPTGSLVALLYIFFVCLVAWPNYLALALPGLPWITMVRLTGFPLAFVLLVCISTSAKFRSEVGAALKAAPLTWKILVAYMLIGTASIAFSRMIFQSMDRFLVAQISWSAVFVASVYAFLKPKRVEHMAVLLWIVALFIGAIGVLEAHYQRVLWVGHIPSFLTVGDPSVQRTLAGNYRSYTTRYRAEATYGTPLGFGEYMALVLPFVMRFMIGRYVWATRVAAAVSCVLICFFAYISGTRTGTVGCLIDVLLYGAVWSFLKWRRERESLLAPAISLAYPAMGAIAFAATILVGRIRHMVWGNGSEYASTLGREQQWTMGLPKILHHPQGQGFGIGGQILGYQPYGLLTIDSDYLATLLEVGVLGFIVYYSLFAVTVFYCGKTVIREKFSDRECEFLVPIAISMICSIFIKSALAEKGNDPLLFMMIGMTVALIHRVRASRDPAPLPSTAPKVLTGFRRPALVKVR